MAELQGRGLSLRQIATELTLQGIQTPRDGNWTAAAVRSVQARIGKAAAVFSGNEAMWIVRLLPVASLSWGLPRRPRSEGHP
jgi:hypothetical protein